MFKILSLVAVMFTAASADAAKLQCFSKYFNQQELRVDLTANIQSETRLNALSLKLDNQPVRRGNVSGKLWSGRKYKNMVAFALNAERLQVEGDWKYIAMTLLVPRGFADLVVGERFRSIITEAGADGGTYNEVLCRIAR